jgi:hypothetical protein
MLKHISVYIADAGMYTVWFPKGDDNAVSVCITDTKRIPNWLKENIALCDVAGISWEGIPEVGRKLPSKLNGRYYELVLPSEDHRRSIINAGRLNDIEDRPVEKDGNVT